MKRIFLITLLLLTQVLVFAYSSEEGKTIFSNRCTACHAIDKNVVGPALMNVDKRHDEKWIISFVHSSQTVIKSGDMAAVNLFNRFNKTPMPDHPDLTDEQVRSIISYIKAESSAIAAAPKSSMQRPHELKANYTPVKPTDYGVWLAIGSSIALLVFGLLLRVKVEGLK